MIIGSRPFLCPGEERKTAQAPWNPSADNSWWRPKSESYPASDQLLPGDVLLFAPQMPDSTQTFIQFVQGRWGSAHEHAQFTHAALYIGLDHLVCEAVPSHGVSYSTLESRLDNYCWIVRRWPDLTLRQRRSIAAEACRKLGQPYGWTAAILEALKEGWASTWDANATRGFVCSRLCDRSITLALLREGFPPDRIQFHPDPKKWITPAVLSETVRLVDVDVGWRRVDSALLEKLE